MVWRPELESLMIDDRSESKAPAAPRRRTPAKRRATGSKTARSGGAGGESHLPEEAADAAKLGDEQDAAHVEQRDSRPSTERVYLVSRRVWPD